eukprot:3308641-Alexandrium_andersonii.AAC.1
MVNEMLTVTSKDAYGKIVQRFNAGVAQAKLTKDGISKAAGSLRCHIETKERAQKRKNPRAIAEATSEA